jgi:RNA polymerase sigma-70 factor (ECF subfamily)
MNTFQCQPEKAHRIAHRIAGAQAADAGDLAQEALIRLWRQWTIAPPENADGWLYRVIRNLHTDAARRTTRHIPLSAGLDSEFTPEEHLPDTRPTPQESLEQQDLHDQVHAALKQIEPDYRIPVMLCDMEGLGYEEIADRMNCPVGTVRSRIHRGRRRLRQLLAATAAAFAVAMLAFYAQQLHRALTAQQLMLAQRAPKHRHAQVVWHRPPETFSDTQ